MPNVMMLQDRRTKRLDPVAIPTVNDAATNNRAHGGHLTDPHCKKRGVVLTPMPHPTIGV